LHTTFLLRVGTAGAMLFYMKCILYLRAHCDCCARVVFLSTKRVDIRMWSTVLSCCKNNNLFREWHMYTVIMRRTGCIWLWQGDKYDLFKLFSLLHRHGHKRATFPATCFSLTEAMWPGCHCLVWFGGFQDEHTWVHYVPCRPLFPPRVAQV
jgi:hypothetical protein